MTILQVLGNMLDRLSSLHLPSGYHPHVYKDSPGFGVPGERFWGGFVEPVCLYGFGWNNGLREAVVTVSFCFEHFFYSSAIFIL